MSVAFDTLKAATRLREEAGFDDRQARVLVDTLAEAMGETLVAKDDLEKTETSLRDDLRKVEASLRGDLEKLEASLRAEIATLRGDLEKTEASLRGEMRELEQRMTIRLGAMIAAAAGIVVAALKLL